MRRFFLLRLVFTACVAFTVYGAAAQTYPVRPIRIIVPLAPGGGNDAIARQLGHKLTETLGQPVLVDNRPGGGSVIASEIVTKAPADGHTLYLVSTSFTAAPALQSKLPFDTLRDFAPLTRLAVVPGTLTLHASLPVKSVRELLALAKSRPGQVTFGSAGIGSGSHMGGELFRIMSGTELVHVAYKGSALVTTALLSGEVMLSFSNPISALPHVKSGRLRMIGVTSGERWPLLPQVPAISESVKGYEVLIWQGMVVAAATPQPIVTRLHRELTTAMSAPDVVERLASDLSRPRLEQPGEFGAFLKGEIEKWGRIIKSAGIRPH